MRSQCLSERLYEPVLIPSLEYSVYFPRRIPIYCVLNVIKVDTDPGLLNGNTL